MKKENIEEIRIIPRSKRDDECERVECAEQTAQCARFGPQMRPCEGHEAERVPNEAEDEQQREAPLPGAHAELAVVNSGRAV